MKEILFEGGGTPVKRSGAAGKPQKTTTTEKSTQGKKPEMTKKMVDLILSKIRDGNEEDAMTLLNAWSNSYNVVISKFFPKSQGSKPKVNPNELGLPQLIADAPKPKNPPKHPKVSNSDGYIKYNGKFYYSDSDILTDDTLNDNQRFNLLKKKNHWSDKDAMTYYKKLLKSGPGHHTVDIRLGFVVGGGTSADADRAMQSVAHLDARTEMEKYLRGEK